MSSSVRMVKLHEFPDLLNDCANLLNEEWPRSQTARLHSLLKSCDSLPLSLILINDKNTLLGHIRIKREFNDNTCAFIESLIVEKSQRGRGFGQYIMNETEMFAKSIGITKLVLTTTNQMGFYKRLGFLVQNKQNPTIHQTSSSQIKSHSVLNPLNPPPLPPPLPLPLPPRPPPPQLLTSKCSLEPKILMFKNI